MCVNIYINLYINIFLKRTQKVIQRLNTYDTKSITKICLNDSVHLSSAHHEMMEYITKIQKERAIALDPLLLTHSSCKVFASLSMGFFF